MPLRSLVREFKRGQVLLCLVGLLAATPGWAVERAYYSTGTGATTQQTGASAAALLTTEPAQARVTLGATGSATVRLPLQGTVPAGYRAGVVVSTNNASLLALRTLGTVMLSTYKSPGTTPLETYPVDATVVQAALLAASGQPEQLEFVSKYDFDQVEVTFNSLVDLGIAADIRYAYGVAPSQPKTATGYLSQFDSPASNYSTAGTGVACLNTVSNPQNAVDSDPTNYASFGTVAGVGCTTALQVNLAGTVPATGYRAGFVVGNAGLLDATLLSGLRLRTYRNVGGTEVAQESSSAATPLQVELLSNDKAFISFPTTQAFDAVSIERSGAVALLNDLNIYYGFGVSNSLFNNGMTIKSFPLNRTDKYTVSTGGVLCLGCGSTVVTPASGAQPYLKFTQTLGAAVGRQVKFQLDGTGLAGNRAGVVLRRGTLLDVDALANLTLATYDAAGNVLETATGASLLKLNLLPDGRQEVVFRTTRDFAQVGIALGTGLGLVTDVNVYSAFADDPGPLQAVPVGPLPVVLTSFGASRPAGATVPEVTWATASEQHSASFVVERATDPRTGFVAVGQVAAAGSNAGPRQYHLRDAAAPQGCTLYYRLRQLDTDGREMLSPVVALAAAATSVGAGWALYPNPAAAGTPALSLSGSVAAGTVVVIYSAAGQLLRQQPVASAEEQPAPAIATAGLPAGIYLVVLRSAAGQQLATQRLVLTN